MTDLNKERELYESVIEKTQGIKMEHLVGISFNAEANQYEISGEKWACELTDACEELNTGWFIWQECVKAKTQAVPDTHIVVPKQPTPKMIDATWDFDEEIIEMSSNTRNEFIWKKMVEASESGAEG